MEQHDPVALLYARAAKHKIAMAAICKRADVAETTPSRWNRDKNGATLATLKKLNDALDAIIVERSQAAA